MKSFREEITDLSPQQVILGIGGSPRKDGNTDILLDHIITGVTSKNLATEQVHLRDCQFQHRVRTVQEGQGLHRAS